MRLRRLLLVVLLVGGFWYVTAHLPREIGRVAALNLSPTSGSGSPLALTEAQAAPAFDSEEQNNFAVYK